MPEEQFNTAAAVQKAPSSDLSRSDPVSPQNHLMGSLVINKEKQPQLMCSFP